jgi:hypothetical protein
VVELLGAELRWSFGVAGVGWVLLEPFCSDGPFPVPRFSAPPTEPPFATRMAPGQSWPSDRTSARRPKLWPVVDDDWLLDDDELDDELLPTSP